MRRRWRGWVRAIYGIEQLKKTHDWSILKFVIMKATLDWVTLVNTSKTEDPKAFKGGDVAEGR